MGEDILSHQDGKITSIRQYDLEMYLAPSKPVGNGETNLAFPLGELDKEGKLDLDRYKLKSNVHLFFKPKISSSRNFKSKNNFYSDRKNSDKSTKNK